MACSPSSPTFNGSGGTPMLTLICGCRAPDFLRGIGVFRTGTGVLKRGALVGDRVVFLVLELAVDDELKYGWGCLWLLYRFEGGCGSGGGFGAMESAGRFLGP